MEEKENIITLVLMSIQKLVFRDKLASTFVFTGVILLLGAFFLARSEIGQNIGATYMMITGLMLALLGLYSQHPTKKNKL